MLGIFAGLAAAGIPSWILFVVIGFLFIGGLLVNWVNSLSGPLETDCVDCGGHADNGIMCIPCMKSFDERRQR